MTNIQRPKIIKRITLKEMPFDRFTEGHFVHATGDYIVLDDGTGMTEYEDYEYEEAENCIYEDERANQWI